MTYQLVSTPSTQEAVMTAIRDFAVSEGWTNENFTAASVGVSRGVMTLSRGDCYVSFRWEGTESEATKSIAMYQALGFSAGQAASPWLQADDSGNGTTSGTSLASERRVSDIGSGPFIALHLFGSDTDEISGNSAPHIYAVLEYAPGKFRHFGFGNIDKEGDWTGGEFVAGHVWETSGSQESNSSGPVHSVLLDGVTTDDDICATLHCEGLPGQSGSSKWATVWRSTGPGNDTAGNPREDVVGGIRASLYTHVFGRFPASSLTGFVPLLPVPLFLQRDPSGTDRRFYRLGFQPNVRMVQIRAFNPGDEVTIGSVTWKVFPVVSKATLGGDNQESANMGIAYAKVS